MLQLFHCVYCFSLHRMNVFLVVSMNAQLFERRRGSNGKSNQFLSRERTSTLQVHFCAFNNEIESIKMNRRFKRHLSCSRYRMSALTFSPSTRHKTVCFVILFISSLKEKNKKISIYECSEAASVCLRACMHFIFHQSVKKWNNAIWSLPFSIVHLS